MRGAVSSLNVSVAAGVVLFEAVRQRTRNLTGVDKTLATKKESREV
jgi:tRNA(Leu) C34 or U34 (ribose-2'-O)-methylase TrmL